MRQGRDDMGMTAEQAFQQALALGKTYTKQSLEGAGALRGEAGFSPIVETTQVSDGTEVSITDKTHTETFVIKDGEGIPEGGEDGQVLTKSGYHAEWKDPQDVSFPDFIQCTL